MLLHEQIEYLCASLKLSAVSTLWPSLAEQSIAQNKSYGEFLLALLDNEQKHRDERTRSMLSQMAEFPAHKALSAFDFKFATGIPKQQIQELSAVTAPALSGEASHFLGRNRLYDGLTLASMGRNDESRRL